MVDRINGALRIIASFSGLAQENMSQLAGWRYLELGRRVERAHLTCGFVRQFAFDAGDRRRLDLLLGARRQPDHLPAALRDGGRAGAGDRPRRARPEQSALGRLSGRAHRDASCHAAASRLNDGRLSPPEQIATALATRLRTADAATVDAELLVEAEDSLLKLVRRDRVDLFHLARTLRGRRGRRSDDLRHAPVDDLPLRVAGRPMPTMCCG